MCEFETSLITLAQTHNVSYAERTGHCVLAEQGATWQNNLLDFEFNGGPKIPEARVFYPNLKPTDPSPSPIKDQPQLIDLVPENTKNVASVQAKCANLRTRLISTGAEIENIMRNADHSRFDKQRIACSISEAFNRGGLFDFQEVAGEDITHIARFSTGIPVHADVEMPKRKLEKNSDIIQIAIFKECGFRARIAVLPLVCFHYESRFSKLPFGLDSRVGPKFWISKLLCLQRNDSHPIYIDPSGRVYKSINDWSKTNQMCAAEVFFPEKLQRPHGDSGYPFKFRRYKTPSCWASKKALDVIDVVVGIAIVSAGAACIATGGMALPFIGAGQVAASVYLGIRGTFNYRDTRRHRPRYRF